LSSPYIVSQLTLEIWVVTKVTNSVATAIADVCQENAISGGSKFTKIWKIFDKIDEMESQRVI
jgi:hypothetical protein